MEFHYALSTNSNSLDSGANFNIYYMSLSSAYIKTSLDITRVLYVSSTTNIYLIAYMSLSSPVFNMSNEASAFITYTRIA